MHNLPIHHWKSVIPGAVWPTIGSDRSAHLQSLLFQLEQTQWLPAEQLRNAQLGQLRLLLAHAQRNIPFYRESLADQDYTKLDWNEVTQLPRLERASIQSRFTDLCSRQQPASHGAVNENSTSGSTGMPIRFLQTDITQLYWEALTLREHFWHKRDFSGKLSVIRVNANDAHSSDWGLPVASIFHTGTASSLNIKADTETQLRWLERENPDYLLTHPTNLASLINLALQTGIRLPRLKQVRTYSEALRPDLLTFVRQAWGVETADVYSAAEVGVIAFQCPETGHYHIQSENLLVEILRPDGSPCTANETGEIVITTLHNFAMPLIRYRIGDYGEFGDDCPCGRGLPVLKKINGRQRNMLRLPDGSTRWPSFPGAMWLAIAPVRQFQLTQTTIDSIRIDYVMDRELNADETSSLRLSLQEKFGYPFTLDFVRVPQIAHASGYKYEDFICALPPDQ